MLIRLRKQFCPAFQPIAVAVALGCGPTIFAQQAESQPNNNRQTERRENQDHQQHTQQLDQRNSGDSDQRMNDDTPTLGVRVLPSPGEGVLIESTIWGSPAQDAGLREGDFIMSVNDTPVSTPRELKAAIQNLDSNAKATLKVWRDERTFTKEIQLARIAQTIPQSHRAWLGVILTPTRDQNQKGVEISYVFPNSPAQESGLRPGDVIIKAGDKNAANIESLLTCLEEHGPGAGCVLAVERDGEVKNVQIHFGDLDHAPSQWLTSAYRAPMDANDWQSGSSSGSNDSDDDVMQALNSLRQEVAELRAMVEGKNSGNRDQQNDNNGDAQRNATENKSSHLPTTAPSLATIFSPAATLAAQVTVSPRGVTIGRGPGRWYGPGFGNRGNAYRYGYRDYSYGRNPNNGWYYNHNGSRWYAPQYNRGNFYYGPRYGVRIGPTWGSYWY